MIRDIFPTYTVLSKNFYHTKILVLTLYTTLYSLIFSQSLVDLLGCFMPLSCCNVQFCFSLNFIFFFIPDVGCLIKSVLPLFWFILLLGPLMCPGNSITFCFLTLLLAVFPFFMMTVQQNRRIIHTTCIQLI